MRDGGHIQHRVLPFEAVESEMVPEWALPTRHPNLSVPFDDDVGLRRNQQVLSEGLREGQSASTEEPCEHVLLEIVRQGRDG